MTVEEAGKYLINTPVDDIKLDFLVDFNAGDTSKLVIWLVAYIHSISFRIEV